MKNPLMRWALEAAVEAGQAIMKIYEKEDFGVELKSDASPLTLADRAAHQVILKHLKTSGIPVLSEEGKHLPFEQRKQWHELWIVDPVDGTKEFIKRNGEFTVNIALVRDGKAVLASFWHRCWVISTSVRRGGAWRLDVSMGSEVDMDQMWASRDPCRWARLQNGRSRWWQAVLTCRLKRKPSSTKCERTWKGGAHQQRQLVETVHGGRGHG